MWSYLRRRCGRRPAVQFHISRLPVEVLEMVFEYLSANERKPVKLVCRYWFEICNSSPLLNDEVFNCIGIYQLSDINQILARSQRRVLNLRFDNVEFNGDLSFWKNNGSRIKTIIFKDCELDCGCFEAAIIHCPNLVHLSIIVEGYLYDSIDSIVEDLERVARTGIVRENLSFLEIHIEFTFHKIGDRALNYFFSIFPKVKILKIHLNKAIGDDYPQSSSALDDSSFDRSKYLFSFTPVLNYLLASTDRIEKLKIFIRFFESQHQSNTIPRLLETLAAMKKLTELSLNLGPMNIQLEEKVEKFLHSKRLRSLTYYASDPESQCSELFSYQLLRSNSCLKRMKIKAYNRGLNSDLELFQKGLKSFLLQFQNLIHHLHIDDISCEELQLMAKYQKKLKSLIIEKKGPVEFTLDFSEHEMSYYTDAFHQLKDIEHLELNHPVSHKFLRSLSPQSVLVNLKYLKINLYQTQYPSDYCCHFEHLLQTVPSYLLRLADAVPFLEGLWIRLGTDIPFRTCLRLCAKLSRLRYFETPDKILFHKKEKREDVQKLFSIRPSLRVLLCHQWALYFDLINRKVVTSDQDDRVDDYSLRSLARPKIGGHRVDWLKF